MHFNFCLLPASPIPVLFPHDHISPDVMITPHLIRACYLCPSLKEVQLSCDLRLISLSFACPPLPDYYAADEPIAQCTFHLWTVQDELVKEPVQ